MNHWKPIASAPKDGTLVYAWHVEISGGRITSSYLVENARFTDGRWQAPNPEESIHSPLEDLEGGPYLGGHIYRITHWFNETPEGFNAGDDYHEPS